MIQKMIQISLLFFLVTLTACLKTRSDVSEQDQAAVYGKKNVELNKYVSMFQIL